MDYFSSLYAPSPPPPKWPLPDDDLDLVVRACASFALVILTVAEEVKGRALGLLVLCIGASALGTFALGELAERAGTSASLVVFGVVGTVAQLAWFKYRPQA